MKLIKLNVKAYKYFKLSIMILSRYLTENKYMLFH